MILVQVHAMDVMDAVQTAQDIAVQVVERTAHLIVLEDAGMLHAKMDALEDATQYVRLLVLLDV